MLRASHVIADNFHIKLVLLFLLTNLHTLTNIKKAIRRHYPFSIYGSKTKNGMK